MPFEDTQQYLEDIPASIQSIEKFLQGMDYAAYDQDERTQAAVERKIVITMRGGEWTVWFPFGKCAAILMQTLSYTAKEAWRSGCACAHI